MCALVIHLKNHDPGAPSSTINISKETHAVKKMFDPTHLGHI